MDTNAQHLGRIIASYSPDRFARQMMVKGLVWLLVSTPACYIAWRYEGTWITAVFGVLGVVTALTGLRYLLALLGRGKHVTLCENGLIFGKHILSWDGLSKVEYSRQASGQDQGTFINDWTFYPHSGKEFRIIQTDIGPRDSYVDIDRVRHERHMLSDRGSGMRVWPELTPNGTAVTWL